MDSDWWLREEEARQAACGAGGLEGTMGLLRRPVHTSHGPLPEETRAAQELQG